MFFIVFSCSFFFAGFLICTFHCTCTHPLVSVDLCIPEHLGPNLLFWLFNGRCSFLTMALAANATWMPACHVCIVLRTLPSDGVWSTFLNLFCAPFSGTGHYFCSISFAAFPSLFVLTSPSSFVSMHQFGHPCIRKRFELENTPIQTSN